MAPLIVLPISVFVHLVAGEEVTLSAVRFNSLVRVERSGLKQVRNVMTVNSKGIKGAQVLQAIVFG